MLMSADSWMNVQVYADIWEFVCSHLGAHLEVYVEPLHFNELHFSRNDNEPISTC